MSLVKTITLPGFYPPATLANLVGIPGASSPNFQRLTLKLVFEHRLKCLYPQTYRTSNSIRGNPLKPPIAILGGDVTTANVKLAFEQCLKQIFPALNSCRYLYQSIRGKRCKAAIEIANQSTAFEGYCRYVTISLIVIEYLILDPSEEVPAQYVSAQRAVGSYRFIGHAYLELEMCMVQRTTSGAAAVLTRILDILTAERYQQHWKIWESTETMNAVRRLIESLSLALMFSDSEAFFTSRDLTFDALSKSLFESWASLLWFQVVRRLRELFMAQGQQIMSILAACGERSESVNYSKLMKSRVYELKAAVAECQIWKRRIDFL